MSMVNGVWHDTVIDKFPLFPKYELKDKQIQITNPHVLGLEPNSEGIKIVKCIKCHLARMYIVCFSIYNCATRTQKGSTT